MHAYRTTTKLKLGLILAAVAIGVASLVFTQRLASRLEAQDERAVELWVSALEFVYASGAAAEGQDAAFWSDLEAALATSDLEADERRRLVAGLDSLQDGAPVDGLDFVFSQIVEANRFSVPALVTDQAMTYVTASRNIEVDGDEALEVAREMDRVHAPIVLEDAPGGPQLVHYGESPLARLIRLFPVVQLAVVGLFILVGYLGFSYVRRSEQSNLWVGMAKEAAHQLGTPLSSMIGWIELLRLGDAADPAMVADELEQDTERLKRVADRFEKIGSKPDLEAMPLLPVRVVARDLAPLAQLQQAVEQRDANELAPLTPGASTREIDRLALAINALLARIDVSVRAQREFSGNVAHELRTPLAGIRAQAGYALAHDDPSVWREQLQGIAKSEERASHQIDQLLLLSIGEEARARLELTELALDELVRDTVLRFMPRAQALRVDLGAEGLDQPVRVRGNAGLLEGLLSNLIDNALRYGASAPEPIVTVALTTAASGAVQLSVTDNGPGLGEGDAARWMRRGTQGAAGVRLALGAGLGLAIVGRYAELLGCAIRAAIRRWLASVCARVSS